jgi:hypothetical protein
LSDGVKIPSGSFSGIAPSDPAPKKTRSLHDSVPENSLSPDLPAPPCLDPSLFSKELEAEQSLLAEEVENAIKEAEASSNQLIPKKRAAGSTSVSDADVLALFPEWSCLLNYTSPQSTPVSYTSPQSAPIYYTPPQSTPGYPTVESIRKISSSIKAALSAPPPTPPAPPRLPEASAATQTSPYLSVQRSSVVTRDQAVDVASGALATASDNPTMVQQPAETIASSIKGALTSPPPTED